MPSASTQSTVSLTGRVALVTGGGRGLGAAYARELALRGAAVVIHDSGTTPDGTGTDPTPANTIAAELREAGARAQACTADASTPHGGRAAVDLAINTFGRLDVVVANAGTIHSDALEDWSTAQFEAQLRNHLLAAFHVTQPAFRVMKAARYGRLIFVSSAAGMFGQPGLGGYAAAKTGMIGLMNVAALEGAEFGITANAIMPMAGTRMASALLGDDANDPDARAFLDSLRVDQVAPVVAYLSSEQCTMTHAVLSAFAGRIAALQVGVTRGWRSPNGQFTAEDVERHLPEITDAADILVPHSIFDEMTHTLSVF